MAPRDYFNVKESKQAFKWLRGIPFFTRSITNWFSCFLDNLSKSCRVNPVWQTMSLKSVNQPNIKHHLLIFIWNLNFTVLNNHRKDFLVEVFLKIKKHFSHFIFQHPVYSTASTIFTLLVIIMLFKGIYSSSISCFFQRRI